MLHDNIVTTMRMCAQVQGGLPAAALLRSAHAPTLNSCPSQRPSGSRPVLTAAAASPASQPSPNTGTGTACTQSPATAATATTATVLQSLAAQAQCDWGAAAWGSPRGVQAPVHVQPEEWQGPNGTDLRPSASSHAHPAWSQNGSPSVVHGEPPMRRSHRRASQQVNRACAPQTHTTQRSSLETGTVPAQNQVQQQQQEPERGAAWPSHHQAPQAATKPGIPASNGHSSSNPYAASEAVMSAIKASRSWQVGSHSAPCIQHTHFIYL